MKIALGILLGFIALVTIAVLAMFSPWIEAAFRNTFVHRTIKTTNDLPWVAPGKRAGYFAKYRADFNTGLTGMRWWGSSSRRSEDPISTGHRAFSFLEKKRAMGAWPRSLEGDAGAFTTYSVYDPLLPTDPQHTDYYGNIVVTYPVRIAPYRFHIVSLEPTVIVMQPTPELIDWWAEYRASEDGEGTRWVRWIRALNDAQVVPHLVWLQNPLEFGTTLPRGDDTQTNGWLWFSPDLERLPTPLALSRASPTAIDIGGGRLSFQPVENGWQVTRE